MVYYMSYICPGGELEEDRFEGSWLELQEEIKSMRKAGFTNISACGVDEEEGY